MSLSRAEVEAMDRDELVDAVVDLSQAVEDLQAEVETLRDDLQTEVENRQSGLADAARQRGNIRDDVDAVAEKVESGDTSDEIDTLHRERLKLARRLTAVEEELDIDATEASKAADGRKTSPLYLLEHVGPEAVSDHAGATLHRARTLVEHADRWGETRTNPKYGTHRVLASAAHDLKTRVEDARDEDLQWRQVYVAMEKVADLGGDHVTFDESYGQNADYGKAIVWQEVDQA